MPIARTTSLTSHGAVDKAYSDWYGKPGGPIAFRLGNGGAGPTGILRVLSEDFLALHAPDKSVPWVCNHSRNTQLALLEDAIDFALTYERDQEALSAQEGWAKEIGVVFHDHFVVVGPLSNPANITPGDTPSECFRKIHLAASRDPASVLFHSRADGSATMVKERQLWTSLSLSPWLSTPLPRWYKTSTLSPSEAVVLADKEGAYLLSDRSTLLRQTALGTVKHTTVYYEPESKEDFLMNGCAGLLPGDGGKEYAKKFGEYLLSERGQNIIATYGIAEVGVPFFANLKAGYAKSKMVGGFPQGGKWVQSLKPKL